MLLLFALSFPPSLPHPLCPLSVCEKEEAIALFTDNTIIFPPCPLKQRFRKPVYLVLGTSVGGQICLAGCLLNYTVSGAVSLPLILQKPASIFAIVKSIFESCSKAVLFFLIGQVSLLSSMCEQEEKV